MAREGKPERYLREGIQPFLQRGETLRYINLGTNKSSFGLEVVFGAIGAGVGGALGGLFDGMGEAAGEGKKDLIVALTDQRLLIVEIKKWGYDFLLSLGTPSLPGAVKETGKARSIPLSEIKDLEYKKKGSFESVLRIHLTSGEIFLAFEKLRWVRRATEMAKFFQATP